MGALQALQNHKPFLVKPGANPGISEIIAEKTSTQSVVSEDVTTGRLNLTESIRNES